MTQYYLNHGKIGEPMITESVESKGAPMRHHARGASFTSSGYGARIPTPTMVRYNGRWRRVYVCCYGNSGTAYIGKNLASGIRVDSAE